MVQLQCGAQGGVSNSLCGLLVVTVSGVIVVSVVSAYVGHSINCGCEQRCGNTAM